MTPRLELNFPNPIERRSDLFDRVPELTLIQDTLSAPTRRPIVIMGERVMGKTSLLNIVVEWATQDSRFCVLPLPQMCSRDAFMEEVLDGIAGEAGTSLFRLGLRDAGGALRLSTVTEFARVAGELCAAAAGKTFLLCLDELDSMLVNCPDAAAANRILDFILHVVGKTSLPIKFVFTLTRAVPQILRSDASPFMSASRIAHLVPWTPDEAREFVALLVQGTCTVDPEAHRLLYAAAGGHPYLTKAVLQRLQDLGRPVPPGTAVTAGDVRDAVEATLASPEVDFTLDNIVKVHFSPDELRVLRQVASGTGPVRPDEIDAEPEVGYGLRHRRYLREEGSGYVMAYGLLGEWLRRRPWADAPPPPAVGPAVGGPAAATEPPAVAAPVPAAGGALPVLVVDESRRRVFLGAEEIALTAQEYRFLNYLAAHAGSVVGRHTITAEVWPNEALLDGVREDRLDALVSRLREKLGGNAVKYIVTRRGLGYYGNPEIVRLVRRTAT